jgi:hypothetical protein
MSVQTVALDFDGVIHAYSKGWGDGSIYDEPVSGALEGIRRLQEHYAVYVHTSRDALAVANWLARCGVTCCVVDEVWEKPQFWNRQDAVLVTNRKLPAVVYVDDRALKFENWPDTLTTLIDRVG